MIQEILLAIQSGKTSFDVSKAIVNGYTKVQELLNNIKNLEKDENLLELRKFIFEAQKRELALLEHCSSLEQKIKSLEFELHQRKILKFNGIVFEDEEGNEYCPTCYQKDAKAHFLMPNKPEEKESWKCTVCQNCIESPAAILRRRDRLNKLKPTRITRPF